jgi:formate dehydrogenase subunit gamma
MNLTPTQKPAGNAIELSSQSIALAVGSALTQHQQMPGALLPVLHSVQEQLGFIPPQAVGLIANGLNLSRAEVHGVVTYYDHFREQPSGRWVIKICRAEACQSMGADALMAFAQTQLACKPHGNSVDGSFSLEPAFCLGFCANAPAIMINEEPFARVTETRFKELIAQARESTKGIR